ncbi:hypothetical protein [uncultured Methylovirgula sp.]|uniref:hypothetical protein n=1 Tax=uncultured Methylovirgula sp. TaxID=1285960 RepID=UPI002610718A|nr:hypothetical protein [uncultured Methylovirgula sp.]
MSNLNMFIPITKVDAQQRLVYGVATAEAEDRTGEICDYASTKPLYEKWSHEIARSTGGKSRGNLRAMHGSVAAGKVTALNFNDKKKQIEICAKVVDDAEWNKVKEGVYTGFSQGGSYARRWTDDDGRTRYTAAPSEISLVDLPCLPEARFEMVKADGSHEWRRFAKDASDIAQLAQILGQLEGLKGTLLLRANEDGAPADTITQLHALVQQAHAILQAMVMDEDDDSAADEDADADEAPLGLSAKRAMALFGKAGARNSAADLDRIQHVHDTAVELGATCGAQKSAGAMLGSRLDRLDAVLDDLLKRVKNIEAQPMPLPLAGAPRAVAKNEDGEANLEKLLADPEALSLLAIKLAQRNGRSFLTR